MRCGVNGKEADDERSRGRDDVRPQRQRSRSSRHRSEDIDDGRRGESDVLILRISDDADDLALSAEPARKQMFDELERWMGAYYT